MSFLLSLFVVVIGILIYALRADKGPGSKYARKSQPPSITSNTETITSNTETITSNTETKSHTSSFKSHSNNRGWYTLSNQ